MLYNVMSEKDLHETVERLREKINSLHKEFFNGSSFRDTVKKFKRLSTQSESGRTPRENTWLLRFRFELEKVPQLREVLENRCQNPVHISNDLKLDYDYIKGLYDVILDIFRSKRKPKASAPLTLIEHLERYHLCHRELHHY